MRRTLAFAAAALAGVLLAGVAGRPAGPAGAAAAPDVAVWLYGADRWVGAGLAAELGRLPAGARRLYLSVEAGPRLLVDDREGARRVAEILDAAHDRFGLRVEAMLLQDPAWAADPAGAAARAGRVLAFHEARGAAGRPGFAGLHFDVEPYTEEAWACGDTGERRALLRSLQAVFSGIARVAAPVRDAAGPAFRLTAALPWWLGPLSAEAREAAPAAWLTDLDELVLMVYGDAGGALVGESGAAVLRRIDDARLWKDAARWPPGRGLRIGLATYEHRDATALAAAMREVAGALAARPGFLGFAVFAHGQPFDVPRAAALEGRVVDAAGRPVAGARIRAVGEEARTNRCGLFVLRRLPAPGVEVAVEADGFRPTRVVATGLVPGRQGTLAPVVLSRP